MTIPDPNVRPLEQEVIPEAVAERPQIEEAPETRPLLISFARYNEKECDLDKGIDSKRARKALQILRDVGVNIFNPIEFKNKLPKLQVVPINNSGDYRKLYSNLADLPDVEIQEAKIDRDKGRLFFFIVERIFHVVAVKDSHYETDKQRR
jgi:hypothetical protein